MARSTWVTKSKLEKVAQFLRGLGLSIQAVDVSAQCVRFHTGSGPLIATDDDELDRELMEYRKKHDRG